jgi:hypothetical protein
MDVFSPHRFFPFFFVSLGLIFVVVVFVVAWIERLLLMQQPRKSWVLL